MDGLEDREVPPPVSQIVAQLISDARSWYDAETAVYLTQARLAGRMAVILGACAVGALLLIFCALTALIVGLLFVLAPHVGFGWATVIVVVATLASAAVLGLVIRGKISQMQQNWSRKNG